MNIERLKEMLRPWLSLSTWHTPHPLDERRFHQALKNAFVELGTQIALEDFMEAMDQLSAELHPNMQEEFRNELIDDFAKRAAEIASYLQDTGFA
jgi:hypothetical protein